MAIKAQKRSFATYQRERDKMSQFREEWCAGLINDTAKCWLQSLETKQVLAADEHSNERKRVEREKKPNG